jgi:hypothetical protein
LNLYTYVYNNPLIYTDPSGHCVAGVDGCLVDSSSGVDHLLNDMVRGEVASNSMMWWAIEQYQSKNCSNAACNDNWDAAQKKLEQRNDEIRHNACSYLAGGCIDGTASFVSASSGEVIVSYSNGQSVNKYSVSSDGVVNCNCFTAGTTVLTEDGEKAIEQVRLGDKVLAKDDETGELAYKEVIWLFEKQVAETIIFLLEMKLFRRQGNILFGLLEKVG